MNKEAYYEAIINTILELGQADNFIVALAELVQRLVIDHLHILLGMCMTAVCHRTGLWISWNNIIRLISSGGITIWYGWGQQPAACLLASVIRTSIRYGNLDLIEDGYGINMVPLATFAMVLTAMIRADSLY